MTSANKPVVEFVAETVEEADQSRSIRRFNFDGPLPLDGREIGGLTNDELYDLIEFPSSTLPSLTPPYFGSWLTSHPPPRARISSTVAANCRLLMSASVR
jgi:hypothetical protein